MRGRGGGGSRPRASGESARMPKTSAMTVWPIIFAALRRPRLRCLTILMKSSRKPDDAEPGEEEEQQQRRGADRAAGEQVGAEVAHQRRQDDDDAAHRGGPALGVVGGRPVLADLLAVAALGEDVDRDPGAEERDQQRDAAAVQDRSHPGSPTRATERRGGVFMAGPPSRSGEQGVGDVFQGDPPGGLHEHHVTGHDILAQPGERLVTPRRPHELAGPAAVLAGPVGDPAGLLPDDDEDVDARRARRGRRRCGARRRGGRRARFISPRTATVRRPRRPMLCSVSSAATIESGLAL